MSMSERETDITFEAKIAACEAVVEETGSAHGLDLQLVEFAVEHYGRDRWGWCADMMLNCGDAYSMMRERMGECGMY